MKILNRRTRLFGAALVLFLSTTGFVHDCDGDGAPTPTGCDAPATGTFGLAIGTEDTASGFVPLTEGDTVTVVRGSQGSDMFPIRVALTGADGAGCVTARIQVRDIEGVTLDVFEGNLETSRDGTQLTTERVYFVIGDWPSEIQIMATIAGNEASVGAQIPADR